ncbi:hypothetical protein M0R45_030744 [Rubus argutus]
MAIVEKSGLSDNGWLQTMYDIRSTWVPAYVNHVFSARMSSSQRAESGHAFYMRFVSKENSLLDFMVQFNRAVTRQRHLELMEDHVDINEKPNFNSPFEMADQMARVYTHTCFKEFYNQLKECCNYKFELLRENDKYMVYKPGYHADIFWHFFIFIKLVDKLHDQYILKRWTKSAKSDFVFDCAGVEITDNKNLLARRSKLCQYAVDVIDKIMGNEEASNMFIDSLETILEKYKSMGVDGDIVKTPIVPGKKSLPSQHVYNEPVQVRAKGCGKRLKGGKEKAKLKAKKKADSIGRFCHGCKKHGQLHDKRNCPELEDKANCPNLQNGFPLDKKDENVNVSSTDDDDDDYYYSPTE